MVSLLKDVLSLGYYGFLRILKNNCSEAVLVYHSVGYAPGKADRYKMNIEPQLFKKHIEFLSSFTDRSLILTFDDGFANIFDIVFPFLTKYNMKTILFITVGFVDGLAGCGNPFGNRPYADPLNWKQIEEMSTLGLEIGSHTLTHQVLTNLNNREAYAEIKDSKKKLEDKIRKRVKYFAYPYGFRNAFDSRIKGIVKEAGYEKAYTNIMGFNVDGCDPFELKRMRIYSDDNMFRLKLKINGGYNWVDAFDMPAMKDG